eukprot:gnl/MRDRNA2_/MRDRNA2_98474_c0_seq1.p1 gnl/MRDRNA2_/MRDRNA2_98474_c0~~gnl/MRDRNA2_/MRDRNA2_98474_c0_seq1.p1  ORF type:complete len:378 (+),score=55.14 gnl/MRDRNA2_/MRDRNA2_98474_c0_seq1:61-1134(+)
MPVVAPGGIIAVTGASGFIGSHIVDALIKAGYIVRAVVRDPTDVVKTEHLRKMGVEGTNLHFCSGDLSKEGSYDEAFVGADAVVHCAAVVEINSVKDPQKEIVDPSVKGTENILASANKSKTVKRIVHTSSIAAVMQFDKQPLDFAFSESDFNTSSSIKVGDPYGYAKVSAEKVVRNHVLEGKAAGYDFVTFNPGVVLGPCLCKAHTKASTVVVRQMLYGNPQVDYYTAFVDVRDVASAHVKALSASEATNERFILVSDAKMNVLELGEPLKRMCPEYVIEAKSSNPGTLVSALGSLPLVGGFIMTEFQRAMLKARFDFQNEKSKEVLKLTYRPLDETLNDTARSMVDNGFIKARTK